MKWLSDDRIDHLRELTVEPDFSATKYQLTNELARGGMGTVYLAEDTELNRQVAIKVLNPPDVATDLRQRMIREAQIIARLEHPGIVPVHDVGVLPDGRVFYAMKYVRGRRLDEYAAETEYQHPTDNVGGTSRLLLLIRCRLKMKVPPTGSVGY